MFKIRLRVRVEDQMLKLRCMVCSLRFEHKRFKIKGLRFNVKGVKLKLRFGLKSNVFKEMKLKDLINLVILQILHQNILDITLLASKKN
jgi:thiamine pyrophosphokinase